MVMGMSLEYAQQRRQFGSAIGDFQMIQQMLADSAMEINACRLALWQIASRIDAGRGNARRHFDVKGSNI